MYIQYRTIIDELNGHFKINETLNDLGKKSGNEFKFTYKKFVYELLYKP